MDNLRLEHLSTCEATELGEMVLPCCVDEITCSQTSEGRGIWKEEPVKLKSSYLKDLLVAACRAKCPVVLR